MDDQAKEPTPELIDTSKHKGRVPRAISEHNKKVLEASRAEQKALQALSKDELFLAEFIRNGGNQTNAAMKVFGFKERRLAAVRGSQAMKRLGPVAQMYLEAKGYGLGKMLDVAADKMEGSRTPEWFDRLMKIAGYADFMGKQGPAVSVNIANVQKDLASEYVIEGEVELPSEEDLPDELD